MSKADIRYLNLLAHFGPNYSYNLSELLDQAFFDLAEGKDVIPLPTSRAVQIRGLRYIQRGDQYFITGLLYKSKTLVWESIPDNNEDPIIDPGTKEVMPYSRFILSLSDHRLFWITKRRLSLAPTPNDFCQFLKRVTLPYLRETYKTQAEIQWTEDAIEAGIDPNQLSKTQKIEKRNYITKYLQDFKLTNELMEIRVVPETSKAQVKLLIADEKYVVKSATFFPHMNNVTDDECEDLFTNADKIARDANSEASVNLKPLDSEVGVKKETLNQILDLNDEKNLVNFKFSLKNKYIKDEKPVTITNVDRKGLTPEERRVSSSIIKSAVKEGEPTNNGIVNEILNEYPDMTGTTPNKPDLIAKLVAKIRALNV